MLYVFLTIFSVVIVGLMLLDLGLFHRDSHTITITEALYRTVGWVMLALVFNGLLYFLYSPEHNWLGFRNAYDTPLDGKTAALQFLQCYVVEQSLSMDNMLVFAMIFGYFRVPLGEQHRVLFWGVVGALLLRGVMIIAGGALITRFDWIMYVFGILLIATATKMLVMRDEDIHPDRNIAVRIARRLYPCSSDYHGGRFFAICDGKRMMTPLFLSLLLVCTCDVMFAIDSIPACFGFTQDTLIVFTSNIFAIMGLRSLYFVLAGMIEKFRYLKTSLIFLLAFVGVKMLLHHHYHIPDGVSLALIGGILAVGVLASIFAPAHESKPPAPTPPDACT
jgi:tellurite resistance protein TerC